MISNGNMEEQRSILHNESPQRGNNSLYKIFQNTAIFFIPFFAFFAGRFSTAPLRHQHPSLLSTGVPIHPTGAVLITGAAGRTGSRLYHALKTQGVDVRAFVRDAENAREILGCDLCDETEGIHVGDVTEPATLAKAFAHGPISTLAITVGVSPYVSRETQRAVEFDGVVNSVRALGENGGGRVVLCSSMGSTETPPPAWSGDIMFWKLNAEAFLESSGIRAVVVKPCGLTVESGGSSELFVGHHDEPSPYHSMSRDDLASVMARAVLATEEEISSNLRFDLCSKPGPPTLDFKGLMESAKWEWQK